MPEYTPTILVVDDDDGQRRLLVDFITSLGFGAAEAASAEGALAAIGRGPPDMVPLDVTLPGMSGIGALPEIRTIAGALPVLLITAHADQRQAVAAIRSGADG
jgi:DNA-binding NtrC family response regulator